VQYAGVEWDEEKIAINKREHDGLGFETAQYVFSDPERLERLDESEGNTSGETRYQTIGKVGPLFFVVFTERGNKARLISARAAEKPERRLYNGYYLIDDGGWTKATEDSSQGSAESI
jgi:uncharacterized DUF497 family protein